ncbi:type II toxin-antitoxin system RelB/DinJ family antitoxin [Streptococcus uberis]|uniref:type II toxin-antitoxin system RelB/DinJ family antitoxin n=1 Tax=Streptococcus uberis TaxID=1349 RepID=UPI0012B59B1F|nr:type II toxin-antitoxin system RelB/DinJ family antitoxin [Streptococcus uberis]MTB58868.1 type II toxin-antitoxin system RelB/DinJ family antitoxin [Streptococcus uberis]
MKNIQVRVDDYVKEESDKIFKELGTSTNEAIKIFLKMTINNNGFPFSLVRESHNIMDRVNNKMLPLSDSLVSEAYITIEGKFYKNSEFGDGVLDERVKLRGLVDEYADEELDLGEVYIKIIDTNKQDLWIVTDADSGDYELVAAHLSQTVLIDDVRKVAILDEYFVFSKQVSAKTRVKLFMENIVPYLIDRDVEIIAFMNAGFWRTEQYEEQNALLKSLKKCGIEVISRGKNWQNMTHFVDLRKL